MRSYRALQKGFTLIELMIVVAIIGILSAIAIPQYQNYVGRSQVSRVMAETGALKTAVESCILEGRLAIGGAAGECDPGGTGSNLLAAATGTSTMVTGTPAAGQGTVGVTNPLVAATVLTATFGNNAAAAIQGTTLTWTRDATGTWVCASTAPNNLRPTGC